MKLFNHLLYRINFLKKTLAMLTVAVTFSALWGADYTWNGGGGASNSWTNPQNWGKIAVGDYPKDGDNAYLDGSIGSITVKLDQTITVSNLYIDTNNTSNSSVITLDTSGNTLTVSSNIYTGCTSGSGNVGNTFNSDFSITGTGKITVGTFDFPNRKDHKINIGSNAVFEITGNYYGNSDDGGKLYFNGNGTLYVPASGANLNYGISAITYDSNLTIKPYGSPTYYKVTITDIGNLPDNEATITITRAADGSATVKYPYKVENVIKTTESFELNNVSLTNNLESELSITSANSSLDLKLKCIGSVAEGAGFTIKIFTPDKSRILSTISWYKGKTSWTGNIDTAWENSDNWILADSTKTLAENLAESELSINAVSTLPVITSGNWTVKSVTVTANASLTQNGGTLQTQKFSLSSDTSKFIVTAGDLYFTEFENYGTWNCQNANLHFQKTLIPSAEPSITLDNNSTLNLENCNLILEDGNLTIPTRRIKTFENITVKTGGNLSFDSYDNFTVTTDVIIQTGAELSTDKNLVLKGNFTNSGTVNLNTSGYLIISGTTPQSLITNTTATYARISDIKNSGYLEFGGTGASTISDFSTIKKIPVLLISGTTIFSNKLSLPASNIIVNKDLILNAGAEAENLLIYNGNFQTKENITVSKDFILVGNGYSAAPFNYEHFAKRPATWIAANITPSDFGKLPDGTVIPSFSGVATVSDGKIITAKKNLYLNGTTLSSTGTLFLSIPQNDSGVNFCGEAVNSTITNCTLQTLDGTADGSKSQLPATGCTIINCLNFDDSEFKISEAKTVWDNRIFVTLNRDPRNSNNEISSALTNIKTSSGCFTAAYSQTGGNTGTTAYTSGTSLYLYTDGTTANSSKLWNTDATGKSAGYSDSTDSHNKHCTTIPYVKIPQFIVSDADGSITSGYVITDKWGKRLKDYSAAPFDDVLDSTPPVLAAVYTGQEKHESSATNQEPYDAHNFVEFRYSEPVNIGTKFPLSASAKVDNENIQTSVQTLPGGGTSFGGLESDGLTLSEIGKFSSLLLNCGRNNNPDNATTHALYRWFSTTASGTSEYQQCRIRLSIAGYVNGTITHNGINYNNWDSYIDSAQTPAGTFIPKISSVAPIAQITDTAKDISGTDAPNQLAENLTYSGGAIPVTQPAALNGFDTLYSNWDTSAPSFVPNRNDEGTDSWSFSNGDNCEIVGTNSSAGGTTINSIEFHLFDNTPAYNTTEPAWFSEIGWVSNASSTKSKTSLVSDANNHFASADLTGGARAFESNTSRRTTGGIRYSTLYATAQTDAFKYSLSGIPSDSFISGNFSTSVSSPLFSGTTEPKNSPAITDSPYFSLGITDAGIPLKTTFNISYNASAGFITDLAGNKMKTYNVKSIDRTAPAYSFVLSPLGSNQLNIVFAKKIVINSSDLKLINNLGDTVSVTENFSTIIPECFELIKIPDSGGTGTRADASTGELQINSSQPAIVRYYPANPNLTIVTLELNRAVTLEDLAKKNGDSKYYLRLIQASSYSGTNYKDPVTNLIGCTTTFIMDEQGNFMTCNEAHAISDFIVSPVSPLYAHISDITSEDGTDFLKNVYSQTSESARNFNRNQQNYGSILHGHEFTIVSSLSDGTPGNTQLSNTANTMNKIGLKMYISDVPDSASVSKTFNYDYKKDLRVWFPVLAWSTPFKAFSNINNTRFWNFDSTLLEQDKPQNGFSFVIPAQTAELFKKNCQATFLFSLFNTEDNEDYKVCSSPILTGTDTYNVSTQNPLFALRLTDPSDFTSLDLWYLRLRSITEQRGGVSILNNVINPTNGEKAVVKVNMPQPDNLNVIIMTLDGNIVRYLQHGTASAGEHFYYWDGTNENGSKCARGMYFVIVKGPDIDENRKIMVVK